jgi:hypothetical protein
MNSLRLLIGCAAIALALSQAGQASAQVSDQSQLLQNPTITYLIEAPRGPQAPSTPQAPAKPAPPAQPPAAQPPVAPVFAEAAPAGTEAPAGGYAPQMLGDSIVYFSLGTFGVPLQQLFVTSPGFPSNTTSTVAPVGALAGSAFKIADNESPMPQDRAFLNTNYFTGVYHSVRPDNAPRLRLTRQIFGAEKTFLDGDASIGVRVPFFQLHENTDGGEFSDFGNVTLIAKVALLRDCECGNVLCAGLALTLPTGPVYRVFAETEDTFGVVQVDSVNPTILQPFIGAVRYLNSDLYLHGFTSVAFSSDDDVPDVWFTDIGVGYFLYRGSCCTVVPTGELHATIPFEQDDVFDFPVAVPDTLVTILGTHFIGNKGLVLTLGWGFPITGPQPFSNELICQVNYAY